MKKYLEINPEIKAALEEGRPIVALESTIISHGMPYPKNVETAKNVEEIIRKEGAIPATIAIIKGRLKVGCNEEDIDYLGREGIKISKASRRDIPYLLSKNLSGATTVAATALIADMAGIRIFATGGIGGVHRGAEESFDISTDLEELAKSKVAVVCAGAKAILDLGKTLEVLETKGVEVIGYQTSILPAFYSRESDFSVNHRLDTPEEIAALIKAKLELGLDGGVLITNPIPKDYSLNRENIDQAIEDALKEMNELRITGNKTTPYLLAKIKDITRGSSLEANIALVYNNALLAAKISKALKSI
jgi:pseudouridine-5'-phosphate glycosidase